jgi:hypothetical protein
VRSPSPASGQAIAVGVANRCYHQYRGADAEHDRQPVQSAHACAACRGRGEKSRRTLGSIRCAAHRDASVCVTVKGPPACSPPAVLRTKNLDPSVLPSMVRRARSPLSSGVTRWRTWCAPAGTG